MGNFMLFFCFWLNLLAKKTHALLQLTGCFSNSTQTKRGKAVFTLHLFRYKLINWF